MVATKLQCTKLFFAIVALCSGMLPMLSCSGESKRCKRANHTKSMAGIQPVFMVSSPLPKFKAGGAVLEEAFAILVS